jgi:hypothetical protein
VSDTATLELILQRIEALALRQKNLEGLVRRKKGRSSTVEDTDTSSTQTHGEARRFPTEGSHYRRELPPHIKSEMRSLGGLWRTSLSELGSSKEGDLWEDIDAGTFRSSGRQ